MRLVDYFEHELSADPSPDEIVRGLDVAIINTEGKSLPWDECYELWESYQEVTSGGLYTEAVEAVFKNWNGPNPIIAFVEETIESNALAVIKEKVSTFDSEKTAAFNEIKNYIDSVKYDEPTIELFDTTPLYIYDIDANEDDYEKKLYELSYSFVEEEGRIMLFAFIGLEPKITVKAFSLVYSRGKIRRLPPNVTESVYFSVSDKSNTAEYTFM